MNKNKILYAGIIVIVVAVAVYIINKKTSLPMIQDNTTQNTAETAPDGRVLEPIKAAEAGDLVVVNYTGKLADGTKFDSSYDAGKPFGFILGMQMVIKGWDEGLVGVKRGDKKTLVIPADKAYGDQDIKGADGKVTIPKNSTLTFDIEVVEVIAKAKVDAMIAQQQEAQMKAALSASTSKK